MKHLRKFNEDIQDKNLSDEQILYITDVLKSLFKFVDYNVDIESEDFSNDMNRNGLYEMVGIINSFCGDLFLPTADNSVISNAYRESQNFPTKLLLGWFGTCGVINNKDWAPTDEFISTFRKDYSSPNLPDYYRTRIMTDINTLDQISKSPRHIHRELLDDLINFEMIEDCDVPLFMCINILGYRSPDYHSTLHNRFFTKDNDWTLIPIYRYMFKSQWIEDFQDRNQIGMVSYIKSYKERLRDIGIGFHNSPYIGSGTNGAGDSKFQSITLTLKEL